MSIISFMTSVLVYNLVNELKDKPGELYPLRCDLSFPNEIEGASEWIEKNLDSVDILINNASISLDWSSINGGIQELKKILDINLLGLSYITKKILQLMRNKVFQEKLGIDNGCIVNINDMRLEMVASCFRPANFLGIRLQQIRAVCIDRMSLSGIGPERVQHQSDCNFESYCNEFIKYLCIKYLSLIILIQ